MEVVACARPLFTSSAIFHHYGKISFHFRYALTFSDPSLDYTKIRKWIKGIGEIRDGRIKIYEQVLQFVNKDYG